jgi:ferritin-like metal-binding protein YciE
MTIMETNARKPESAKSSTKETQGLRGLFESGLKDIYWTEKVLTKTLPKMAKNANSPELVETLKNHLSETEEHVSRLEKVFETTGIKPTVSRNNSVEGLLKESDNVIDLTKKGSLRDAGIIAASQKLKHYEIASYGTLHAYAKTLGEDKVANLLAMSLEEEKKIDAALTGIAVGSVNFNAAAMT